MDESQRKPTLLARIGSDALIFGFYGPRILRSCARHVVKVGHTAWTHFIRNPQILHGRFLRHIPKPPSASFRPKLPQNGFVFFGRRSHQRQWDGGAGTQSLRRPRSRSATTLDRSLPSDMDASKLAKNHLGTLDHGLLCRYFLFTRTMVPAGRLPRLATKGNRERRIGRLVQEKTAQMVGFAPILLAYRHGSDTYGLDTMRCDSCSPAGPTRTGVSTSIWTCRLFGIRLEIPVSLLFQRRAISLPSFARRLYRALANHGRAAVTTAAYIGQRGPVTSDPRREKLARLSFDTLVWPPNTETLVALLCLSNTCSDYLVLRGLCHLFDSDFCHVTGLCVLGSVHGGASRTRRASHVGTGGICDGLETNSTSQVADTTDRNSLCGV